MLFVFCLPTLASATTSSSVAPTESTIRQSSSMCRFHPEETPGEDRNFRVSRRGGESRRSPSEEDTGLDLRESIINLTFPPLATVGVCNIMMPLNNETPGTGRWGIRHRRLDWAGLGGVHRFPSLLFSGRLELRRLPLAPFCESAASYHHLLTIS
uniref:Putative secreted protein n=1 Tax=Anopheles marajoara TaxID=58244 RepID=A0A2M4C6F4_9DIPT